MGDDQCMHCGSIACDQCACACGVVQPITARQPAAPAPSLDPNPFHEGLMRAQKIRRRQHSTKAIDRALLGTAFLFLCSALATRCGWVEFRPPVHDCVQPSVGGPDGSR
jgi:hypothetical protein